MSEIQIAGNVTHVTSTLSPMRSDPIRPSKVRLAFGYGLAAAVAPYLVLKVLWVAGVMVGVPDGSPAHDGWEIQNIVTGGMDLVAIMVAMALTYRWGMRLPAFLVVAPAWIGIGFLLPAMILVIIGFSSSLFSAGTLVSVPGGLVENWTYAVVGSSFAVQGVLLTILFVLYARARWADLLGRRPPVSRSSNSAQVVLGAAGAALALGVGVTRLFQAIAAPPSWSDGGWTLMNRAAEVVEGSLALVAAVGILALCGVWPTRFLAGRPPFAVILAMTWAGTGTMVAYGVGRTVSLVAGAELSEQMTPAYRLINFAATLAGLVIALVAALAVGDMAARVNSKVEEPGQARTRP